MKNKYSIEISHIYAKESFSYEQEKSIYIAKETIKNISEKDYSLKVLIDDFHQKLDNKNLNYIFDNIKKNNINIDLFAFEKEFNSLTEEALSLLDNNLLKLESFRKENKKVLFLNIKYKKVPLIIYKNNTQINTCIFLSFIWQLCRLGILNYPDNTIYNSDKVFYSEQIINILPIKYKPIEDNVLILHNNIHNKKVLNIYF